VEIMSAQFTDADALAFAESFGKPSIAERMRQISPVEIERVRIADAKAPVTVPATVVPALPAMLTNSKEKYEANLDYVRRTLQSDGLLSFDDFRGVPMLQRGVVPVPMADKDYIDLRTAFEREKNFAPIGKELMRDAVLAEAQERRFDSGIAWLDSLVWDGVPRVERFMHTHFGAEDSDYTRAVGLYMWSGLAGRMLEPGCQLDMVIALLSRQGTKKSTGLASLVPDGDWFTDGLTLHKDDDNFKRLIKGKVVVEISELAGLSKADVNVVKRCITRATEKWIEKYQTTETSYKRRCMLFASTNEERFLPPDETGQRRWLPVEIVEIDRDSIKRDRDQLWAEGAAIWNASGIAYAEAERLAKGRHVRHEQTDIWVDKIAEWLETPQAPGELPPSQRPLRMDEILRGAVGLSPAHQDMKSDKRGAVAMRELGYEKVVSWLDGKTVKRWVRQAPPPPSAA
jgi:predicted P-loop ATPase